MSANLESLDGTESLEELEAMLQAAELEGGDNANDQSQPADTATKGNEPGVTTVPPTAEPEASKPADEPTQVSEPDKEPEKVILSKDGKHQIPYDVLEAERAQRQQLAEENARLKAQAAERDKLQQVLEKHGIDPSIDPDALNVEEIEQLAQDYPELGKVLTGIAKRVEAINQRAATAPSPQQTDSGIPQEVQTALQAVPVLKEWMSSDPDRASLATQIDDRLRVDPEWKDKPLSERFAEVAKRTKLAFGDAVEPAKEQEQKPTEPEPKARDHIPASPSDLGQSVQHQTQVEKYSAMTQEQLMAEMSGMTAAQIEELLAAQGM